MKIDIVHPGYLRVAAGDLERAGLGGNETAMVLASRLLAARGHEVRVFADCDPAEDQGARWLPLPALDEREYRDVVIFWVRTKGSAPGRFNAPVRAVKPGTRKAKDGLLEQVLDGSVNLIIAQDAPAGKGWRKRPAASPPPMTSPRSPSDMGRCLRPGPGGRPRPGRRWTDPARYATRPGRRAIGLTCSPSGQQQSPSGVLMLPTAGKTPRDVLAILRAHAARAAGADQLLAIGAQPLSGGRNNAVYQWESPDGPVCVKIYRADDRRRAEREWLSLAFLSGHQASSAPAPLWADPDPGQPAIGMTFLPGRPFPETGDRQGPLRALAAVQRQYAGLPLSGELATLERIDSASHYIRRITNIWAPVINSHPRDALTRDLLQVLSEWEDSADAAVLAEPARRIFSRGDSNLLNWLWDGTSVRVVDYEFAGYSDLAFDCADLTEHISSREAEIDDQAWAEIVSLAGLGGADQRRFEAAQRTCALRWLAVLWKQRDSRTEEFTSQFDRVRRLQGAGAAI